MNKLKVLLLCLVAVTVTSMCPAAIITSVDRMYGQSGDRAPYGAFTGESDPLLGTLAVGEYVYSDREFRWVDVANLAGAELVRTFNNDKASSEIFVQYVVTVSRACTLALTIDDRIPEVQWSEAPSQQAAVDMVVQTWAPPGTFTDSGIDLFIDEANGPKFSVYTAEVEAGTYVFGLQPSNLNFYSIIAIPEPATLMLLGLGGLLLRKRR
ncbi:MAG TPA: PEP-CTERM sorting domain-containing protein [Anaerohalosphaeraceae bacterium]|jgi:hypothetical protein|nr:PEP-CTERM sorting domain-containing protein [Anaerohalosphaeraceae bacterium]HRT50388.1 PEP-CTERM sorting domain-containing protein [Anaerohalosphaeraceae bacterium]HRT86319.1 PEP-CTERM sorting domain-containing protein [Anaerohalosphaeraceae bacterium]